MPKYDISDKEMFSHKKSHSDNFVDYLYVEYHFLIIKHTLG